MSSQMQNISQSQILDAIKQLPSNELEDFVQKILMLQAKKRSNNLSETEARLLKKIYRKFPSEKVSQIKQLRERAETEDLNETEYQDLALLSDSLEEFHAQRMKNLAELSKLRGLSLEETMAQIGIKYQMRVAAVCLAADLPPNEIDANYNNSRNSLTASRLSHGSISCLKTGP